MSSSSPQSTVISAVKTEAEGGNALLVIKVTSQMAPEVTIRVRRDVTMLELVDHYCGNNSIDPRGVVFLDSHGRHSKPSQTPNQVGLKDGDEIDIMLWQEGGALVGSNSFVEAEDFRV